MSEAALRVHQVTLEQLGVDLSRLSRRVESVVLALEDLHEIVREQGLVCREKHRIQGDECGC